MNQVFIHFVQVHLPEAKNSFTRFIVPAWWAWLKLYSCESPLCFPTTGFSTYNISFVNVSNIFSGAFCVYWTSIFKCDCVGEFSPSLWSGWMQWYAGWFTLQCFSWPACISCAAVCVVFSGRRTCSSCCFVVTQPYRTLCIWFLQLFSFCSARVLILVFNVVFCIHVVQATATYTYRNTIRWWFRAWFTLGEAGFFNITQCSFNCKKPKIMNKIKIWLIVQPQWQHTMRWS